MSLYRKRGAGYVPALPMLQAAGTEIVEAIPDAGLTTWVQKGLANQLEFTVNGLNVEELREALAEVLEASQRVEPVVETGNRYGVSSEFHKMNSALFMDQLEKHDMYEALKPEDKQRAKDMFGLFFLNDNLRNRNPLHTEIVDACIIGNLLNFPKHIFGFPYGAYATDGNESLSLVLYSYREEKRRDFPEVLYIGASDEADLMDIRLCVERLGMEFEVADLNGLLQRQSTSRVVVAMTSFENPSFDSVAQWCVDKGIDLHLHIRDKQWRSIFQDNKDPAHFTIPPVIRSISIEEGLFNSGYSLYRDAKLRDGHLDVGLAWQTAYMSPNEGGSGNSVPLFMDFCFIMLGWSALGYMAKRGLGFRSNSRDSCRLQPTVVQPHRSAKAVEHGPATFEAILTWARESAHPKTGLPREELEAELGCFQREFLGGKSRELEMLCTGGGTRSINMAFESVLKRARSKRKGSLKVITGNPHLAVERAERRFGFNLIRVDVDGALCVEQLKEELRDPAVIAVYTQTLSYTDGTSDPLLEILQCIEAANQTRPDMPITLINDSCLAFAVLVMNDGSGDSQSMRLLDLTENCITPTIVTLDAHKHLGTDKGVSTVMGTKGTLCNLAGHVKVGAQPAKEDLARAIANMWLVGRDGYFKQYADLAASVEKVVRSVESVGMSIVHARNRKKGSTVIAVEDPSGACKKILSKRGHTVAELFGLSRHDKSRCQTGWQVSFTCYSLRQVRGGRPALDVFISDILEASEKIKGSFKLSVAHAFFRENSFPALLLSGNPGLFVLEGLLKPGRRRALAQLIVRRYLTASLDCGTICSLKRPALKPLQLMMKRYLGVFMVVLVWLLARRRLAMRGRL